MESHKIKKFQTIKQPQFLSVSQSLFSVSEVLFPHLGSEASQGWQHVLDARITSARLGVFHWTCPVHGLESKKKTAELQPIDVEKNRIEN